MNRTKPNSKLGSIRQDTIMLEYWQSKHHLIRTFPAMGIWLNSFNMQHSMLQSKQIPEEMGRRDLPSWILSLQQNSDNNKLPSVCDLKLRQNWVMQQNNDLRHKNSFPVNGSKKQNQNWIFEWSSQISAVNPHCGITFNSSWFTLQCGLIKNILQKMWSDEDWSSDIRNFCLQLLLLKLAQPIFTLGEAFNFFFLMGDYGVRFFFHL